MRKAIIGAAIAAMIGAVLVLPAVASAGDPFQATAAKQLAASACGSGPLVVNVVEQVINDADSGFQGNWWAYDSYQRVIKVWQTGDNAFCATVSYTGKFTTVAGLAPASNGGNVAGGITGTMNGGARFAITGALNASPSWPRFGNVGVVDYACHIDGANDPGCGGYVSWISTFFGSGYTYDYSWWGWMYKTARNGTWINAEPSTGNIQ